MDSSSWPKVEKELFPSSMRFLNSLLRIAKALSSMEVFESFSSWSK